MKRNAFKLHYLMVLAFCLSLFFVLIFFPKSVFASDDYHLKIGGANVGFKTEYGYEDEEGSEGDSGKGDGSEASSGNVNNEGAESSSISEDGEGQEAAGQDSDEGTTAAGTRENEDGRTGDNLGTSYTTYEVGNEKKQGSSANISLDLTGRIPQYVYAGDIDLSGMNYIEAEKAIDDYVAGLKDDDVTLVSVNDNKTVIKAGDLGLDWANTDIVSKALKVGTSGNIIARYKALKDRAVDKKVFDIELSCKKGNVNAIVQAEAEKYNVEPKSARVKRENGVFLVLEEGSTGFEVNVEPSVEEIMDEMKDYTGENKEIKLAVTVTEPRGTDEDFLLMKDVLGSFHTSFSSSGSDRSGNVRNGAKLINGTMLYPGDQFSVYKTVSPFTEENGYFLAGSYANGLVVESLGGGICQVSSTLYNAVLRAELQVDERYNHSMIVTYVDLSSDAAIAGTAKDFKFTNNLEDPIYIEGYTTDDKEIYFNIYGVEKRPENRTISFESKEISKTDAEGVKIVADPSEPVGSISSQSAHNGYQGELWKIVKVDGVETERVQINKSNYKMVPKTVSVGTMAEDPEISNIMKNAIATGDLEVVKGTISNLQAMARGEQVDLSSVIPVQKTPEQIAMEQYAAALAQQAAEQQAAAEQEASSEGDQPDE